MILSSFKIILQANNSNPFMAGKRKMLSENNQEVHNLFIKNRWTLSLAESCTGGALAAALTKIPDCSRYFLGSLVCYSNSLKESILKVPSSILNEHGAVSQMCAIAMVKGLLQITNSDFGLAITGIAGPSGGSPEKPVGTVWIAVARNGHEPQAMKFTFSGNREAIIQGSVQKALELLLQNCRI